MVLSCWTILFFVGPLPNAEAFLAQEAPLYRAKGYEAQQRNQFEKATNYYQKAIAMDPAYPMPHNDLGIIYEEKGWFDRAEGEYLKAIAIDPHFVDAYANLALLYERMDQIEKALVYWKKRIEYGHPNDPWTQKAIDRVSLISKHVALPPEALPPVKGPGELLTPHQWPEIEIEESQRKDWPKFGAQTVTPEDERAYGPLGPTETAYLLGPGDQVGIQVWQHPDLSADIIQVRSDGYITAPLVDDIYVNGRTPAQVDAEITEKLSKTIRQPEVSVFVTGSGSKAVYVLGEVNRPGRYGLTKPMTAMEMIARAGQWKDSGVLSSVMVVRRGWTKQPQVFRVDLTKVVRDGDVSKDMVLQNGDIVFIPRNFIEKLNNFLEFFTKHFVGRFVSEAPFTVGEPVDLSD